MLDLIDREPLLKLLNKLHEKSGRHIVEEIVRLGEASLFLDQSDCLAELVRDINWQEALESVRRMVREAPAVNPDIGDLQNADVSLIIRICHRGASMHLCTSCRHDGRIDRPCPRFTSNLLLSVLDCDGFEDRHFPPGASVAAEPVKPTDAGGGVRP